MGAQALNVNVNPIPRRLTDRQLTRNGLPHSFRAPSLIHSLRLPLFIPRVSPYTFFASLSPTASCSMKPWTTPEQFVWLSERIPHWHRRRCEKGLKFLEKVTIDFCKAFPDCTIAFKGLRGVSLHPFLLPRLLTWIQKIQQWFYYHGKLSAATGQPPPPVPFVVNFGGKRPRRLVPLTLPQAYSRLHCTKGSPLREELHAAWKGYIAGDEATLEKYHHLFPAQHNPGLPYVAFQQVVLKHKVATLTEEELSTINEFIDNQFQEAEELREQPWRTSVVDGVQPDTDAERQYIEE